MGGSCAGGAEDSVVDAPVPLSDFVIIPWFLLAVQMLLQFLPDGTPIRSENP